MVLGHVSLPSLLVDKVNFMTLTIIHNTYTLNVIFQSMTHKYFPILPYKPGVDCLCTLNLN